MGPGEGCLKIAGKTFHGKKAPVRFQRGLVQHCRGPYQHQGADQVGVLGSES